MMNSELINRNISCIGKAVRKFRKKEGWSQEYLGFKAGLDRTYIGGLERGERNATISTLTTISYALNISLFELMKEAEQYEFRN